MRYRILPPQLQDIPVWKDYSDSIDEVMVSIIEEPRDALLKIRDTHQFNITDYAVPQSSYTDIQQFDKSTHVKQVEFLGFNHNDSSLFNTTDYQRMYNTLGSYYQEKGTKSFIDYFGFVLNSVFTLEPLWTQDYVTFLPEGNAGIGTPIHLGGTWYPTSHVDFKVDLEKFGNFSQKAVTGLFRAIAPINLVMRSFVYELKATTNLNLSMVGSMHVTQGSGFGGSDLVTIAVSGSMTTWQPA